MSDFSKAVARISEGFCPIHGVQLRKVSEEWLTTFLERQRVLKQPVPLPPSSVEAAQCGMCDAGRIWWVDHVDITTYDSGPKLLPMLRCAPVLGADERLFLYDRGDDAGDGGSAPR